MRRIALPILFLLMSLASFAQNPTPLSASATDSSITVSWRAVPGVSTYYVWLPDADGTYGLRFHIVARTSDTFYTFYVPQGTTLQVEVTSDQGSGMTGFGSRIVVSTLAPVGTIVQSLQIPSICKSLHGCYLTAIPNNLFYIDSYYFITVNGAMCSTVLVNDYQQFGPAPTYYNQQEAPFSFHLVCSGAATNGQKFTAALNGTGALYFTLSGDRYRFDAGNLTFTWEAAQ